MLERVSKIIIPAMLLASVFSLYIFLFSLIPWNIVGELYVYNKSFCIICLFICCIFSCGMSNSLEWSINSGKFIWPETRAAGFYHQIGSMFTNICWWCYFKYSTLSFFFILFDALRDMLQPCFWLWSYLLQGYRSASASET